MVEMRNFRDGKWLPVIPLGLGNLVGSLGYYLVRVIAKRILNSPAGARCPSLYSCLDRVLSMLFIVVNF
jgi:hypothetical protein